MELTKMDESANSAGQSLEQLGLRLRCWREARVRGQRIPAEMWTAAVGMARQLGVHRVAKVLHLDYVRLKKRVQGTGGVAWRPWRRESTFTDPWRASTACRRPTVPCTRAARMRQRDARQNTPRFAASVTASLSLATAPSACWCCAGWPLTLVAHADELPATPYPARRIRL